MNSRIALSTLFLMIACEQGGKVVHVKGSGTAHAVHHSDAMKNDEDCGSDEHRHDLKLHGDGDQDCKKRPLSADIKVPAGEKVAYAAHMQKLLALRCLSCHSGASDPDLRDYDKAKASAGESKEHVERGEMPPKETLAPEEADLFKRWISDGLLK